MKKKHHSVGVLQSDNKLTIVDLHEYLGGPHAVPRTPHPVTGEKLPTTLGHEFSGIIEEVGADVTDLKVGDKVAVKPNLSDGTCWPCSMGRINCCNSLGFIGYSGECIKLFDPFLPAHYLLALYYGLY